MMMNDPFEQDDGRVYVKQCVHWKSDEKAMIRNRYNQIPHPAPDTKRERYKVKQHKPRKAKRTALSQQMDTWAQLFKASLA